jgi:hypothetical protein
LGKVSNNDNLLAAHHREYRVLEVKKKGPAAGVLSAFSCCLSTQKKEILRELPYFRFQDFSIIYRFASTEHSTQTFQYSGIIDKCHEWQ